MSPSNDKHGRAFEDLNGANFYTWIEHIKDYILQLDHEDAADMYNDYEWIYNPANVVSDDNPDPGLHDYQTADNAALKKLRTMHNKAYRFIRDHLTEKMFDKTIGHETSVPKLLRLLRESWNDGSPVERDNLRKDFRALRLGQFDDMETFIFSAEIIIICVLLGLVLIMLMIIFTLINKLQSVKRRIKLKKLTAEAQNNVDIYSELGKKDEMLKPKDQSYAQLYCDSPSSGFASRSGSAKYSEPEESSPEPCQECLYQSAENIEICSSHLPHIIAKT